MARFTINFGLFVMFLLLEGIFYLNNFPWWSDLIIAVGFFGIVCYTNIALDVIEG